MKQNFITYCNQHQLVDSTSTTLIAVSGGVDSVVLCDLMFGAGWPFAIAHCNFQLRGDSSEEDALFCKALSEKYQVPFYTTRFSTNKIAEEQKESVQLTARNLRYSWLEQIRFENQFSSIATAHHINDRIETFLYNFTKGTGIRGLRSIPSRNGLIVRPLLFASKDTIVKYAEANQLDFRIDRSNASTKYNRNKIRLEAIPVLKAINPSLEQTASHSFKHLEDIEKIYAWSIQHWKQLVLRKNKEQIIIDLVELQAAPGYLTILYELIRPYGFQKDHVTMITSKDTKSSGAQFTSTDYRLLINRQQLIISPLGNIKSAPLLLTDDQTEVSHHDIQLQLEWDGTKPEQFGSEKNIAYLDQEKLQLPLQLRKWAPGDSFCPLGMNGKSQKIKDFFTNEKFSIYDKEQTWLLCSDETICWIVGHRIDNRFKVEDHTRRVLKITLL